MVKTLKWIMHQQPILPFKHCKKGVGKVMETKTSNPPKVQLKNGTIFNMDTEKQIQNILK